ncbi:MAG: SGNH/GDSL hydrolase family protein [Planctomycetia bacterium]|nr:SGNH/GDSL hydrolase family protein [Planctomycetia bacterium]
MRFSHPIFFVAVALSSLLFAMCARAENGFFKVRRGIPNSRYYFEKNIVGNQYVFFIGNEVLSGAGLKDSSLRYSTQMIQAFKKYFPESNIIETRHMQPGGSWFARYRTSSGQAVFGEVICSGHLAILDCAAGDSTADETHVKTWLEELIRQTTLYRATHSIIVVYTLTPAMLDAYRAGRTPDYIAWCEEIAEHYDVPSLNLAQYAAEKILAGEISEAEFSQDGILPTDAGANIYADATRLFVDALMATDDTEQNTGQSVVRYTLPAPKMSQTNAKCRIVAYENAAFSPGWKSGQESPILPFRHLLTTSRRGETLSLSFVGSEVGLIDVVGADSACLEFSIDGGAWEKIPNAHATPASTQFAMRPILLAEGLEREKEHTFVLRTSDEGVARIGGILLNGTTQNPFEGLSTLERIDKIYGAMDPIRYTPEADRFRYLPKTMAKLRDGGTLRMVLLGDSIMGNTSGSNFELLLERRYPKCDIVKIASLRSSTGCRYYQDENRVEEYVVRHQPDLLIIGGISNGGDWEAIRSVIRQSRAKLPELEILLVTPVFGSVRDSHIKNWQYELDETRDPFRFHLRRVAEEEKCAYFDMTAPWWRYILESGKTYGWFMGDAVHANARGCQIIGRLLDIYFTNDNLSNDNPTK